MLRWLFRLMVGAAVLAGAVGGIAAFAYLEFGERPVSSLQPSATAPDVKFIEANGIRFAYVEEGQGPLVLLFHGYPETARSWKVVQQRIAAAGYRVVAPSMRGYPPSGFGQDYSVKTLGQDVIALIDAFGAESAVVVGHDWGASAVYRAAATQPSKISKLVALSIPHPNGFAGDPTIFLDAPHFLYYQLPWAERLLWSNDFAHVGRIYREWSPSYDPPSAVLDEAKAALRVPGATESVLAYYWDLFRADPAEGEAAAAKPLSMPVLVLAGDEDVPAKGGRFEKARSAFTGPYTYVELKGVGHFPQLEAPEETGEAIVRFLGVPTPS
ncbi:MAG: alpha/beta hydrolase [Alphaproteobacteria bacterium]|nr:alpha/beta hydrolase [Alphaproteobacteria bacterium]